jgi:hypothetical protein
MTLAATDNMINARRGGVMGAAACFVLAAAAGAFAEPSIVSGPQIQAAFVYNFTKFVEWPEGTFANKTQPIVIAVLGTSELTEELGTIVEGRKVNGRPIVVRSVADGAELVPAQVLFVGESEDARFAQLEPVIGRAPILTVGESEAFAAAGGAFRFVEHEGKLRFEINMTSVEQSGLKVSGELQKLATAVRRQP